MIDKNKLPSLAWMMTFVLTLTGSYWANAQKKTISITIDDVPNTTEYQKNNFNAKLLHVLDSLNIPFTLFINEGRVYQTAFLDKNSHLLEKWIEKKQATVGNHTFSHSRYSEVGIDSFSRDILQGEIRTKAYAHKNNKEIKYFRFPFNDMGKDSVQHVQMRKYLQSKGYTVAPFTIESSDWMFNAVYCHYLERGEIEKAQNVGSLYVSKTMELVSFFESISEAIYKRPLNHIYLCHDNAINADYLVQIIEKLRREKYEIVNLEESLTDVTYQQPDSYYKKWGISWLYRWIPTQKERTEWMKQEPSLSEIEDIYTEILSKQK